jgi:hypothetical protein
MENTRLNGRPAIEPRVAPHPHCIKPASAAP